MAAAANEFAAMTQDAGVSAKNEGRKK